MGIENRIRKKEGRAIYDQKGPEAPFLISFPRSGRHWYTLLLEKNLKIPVCRYQTPWVGEKTAETMRLWSSHRVSLVDRPNNYIYLYRQDSVSVLFSLFMMNRQELPETLRVEEQACLLRRHRDFYLPHAGLTVLYEDLVRDPLPAVAQGSQFFEVEFDPADFQEITREEVNALVGNEVSHVDRQRYLSLREEFGVCYGNLIREIV